MKMEWFLSWTFPSGVIILVGALLVAVGGYKAFIEQRRHEKFVTGGDSYLAIMPAQDARGEWHLTWKHLGNFHLYDVEISIEDPDLKDVKRLGTVTSMTKHRPIYSLGDPMAKHEPRRVRTEMNARNDTVVQVFLLRPVDGKWEMQLEEFYRASERGRQLSADRHVPRR